MSIGQWYHFAVTYNSATNTGTLYIDGEMKAQNTSMTLSPSDLNNLSNFWLGRSAFPNDSYLAGQLDEVRLWNIERSENEIMANKDVELTGTEANLIAYYNFNQGEAGGDNTGITTLNDVANGENGSLVSFALNGNSSNWLASSNQLIECDPNSGGGGGENTCSSHNLDFDGIDDYVSINEGGLSNFGTGDFTIEFWINTTLSEGTLQPLISKRSDCGCGSFWNFFLKPSGEIYFELSGPNCDGIELIQSTSPVNNGIWTHVAAVRRGNTLYLYTTAQPDVSKTTSSIANISNGATVEIGSSPCIDAGFASPFKGKLDEIRIWNYARSNANIVFMRNRRLSGEETDLIAAYHCDQGEAEGNNGGENKLFDISPNNFTGDLINFALNGSTSNWTATSGIEIFPPCQSDAPTFTFVNDTNNTSAINNSMSVRDGLIRALHTVCQTFTTEGEVVVDEHISSTTIAAGESITFGPGFHVPVGTGLNALVDPGLVNGCTNSILPEEESAENRSLITQEEASPLNLDVKVFPNPFSYEAQINTFLPEAGSIKVVITDLQGKPIKVIDQQGLIKGWNTLSFNRESMSDGLYFLTVVSEKGFKTVKLVIAQ